MASVNRVILLGNLCADPETRYSPDGKATTAIRLATNETWKDKATGEKKEKAEFHRVVFFGKPAEVLGEHAKKGGCLYVEGRLSTRKWQDKSGADRYSTEIIGDQFQFVGAAPSGASKPSADQSAAAYKAAKDGEAPAAKKPNSGSLMDMDSDIPF